MYVTFQNFILCQEWVKEILLSFIVLSLLLLVLLLLLLLFDFLGTQTTAETEFLNHTD